MGVPHRPPAAVERRQGDGFRRGEGHVPAGAVPAGAVDDAARCDLRSWHMALQDRDELPLGRRAGRAPGPPRPRRAGGWRSGGSRRCGPGIRAGSGRRSAPRSRADAGRRASGAARGSGAAPAGGVADGLSPSPSCRRVVPRGRVRLRVGARRWQGMEGAGWKARFAAPGGRGSSSARFDPRLEPCPKVGDGPEGRHVVTVEHTPRVSTKASGIADPSNRNTRNMA